jgi:hypothetical protein
MTDEDLEKAIARTKHVRYSWLVSDENPDAWSRGQYRAEVERLASDSVYPSLATQAVSAMGAAARFVGSGFATVDQAEFDRRHAICETCEHFDAAQNRCRECACYLAVKPWSKAERCPEGRWEGDE